MNTIKIEKISDIIPLFDGNRTISEVVEMIEPKKSRITVDRWIKKLKDNGFEIKVRKVGRRGLKI